MAGRPLTPKRARFVEEYLRDLNGAAAARRAGYAEASADVEADRLLGNAEVKAAIDAAIAARSARTRVTLDEVISELRDVGFADPDEERDAKPDEEDPRRRRSSLTYDHKLRALHDLCDHLGGFKQTVKHEGSVTVTVVDPYAKAPDEGGNG